MAKPARDALNFPSSQAQNIDPYLPPSSGSDITNTTPSSKPYVTLTFATSLDSNLSLAPGLQTALSGPQSKAMTHYLRSKHDAILIGVGTAVADNPSLNCRFQGVGGYGGVGLEGQPRPIVIDPRGRWQFSAESKVLELAKQGKGRAPWIVSRSGITEEKKQVLESVGGRFLGFGDQEHGAVQWREVLDVLANEGIRSVMIEGGGGIINDLLVVENFELVDSVIVTIAPVWLGKGGVQVCPDPRMEKGQRVPVGRLKDVMWVPLGEDVVLCGHSKITQTSGMDSRVS
jgi:2,5-diamino-6-(ribosylamino)-4(3H)-pyrimidinone 5'-phosphate reductase